jgi:enoyl-CoA hydratase/carnithine racemase
MSEGRIEIREEGRLLHLTLANPGRRNAVSVPMWRTLTGIAASLAARSDVRCLVIRGSGGTFSAGADISGFEQHRSGEHDAGDFDDLVETACRAIGAAPVPTIAAIEGFCIGAGVSLACACDLRIAAAGASFALPAARLGLGYDPRGIARLARIFGEATARQLLLSGDRVPAERAHAIGAIQTLVPAVDLDAAVETAAARITDLAPLTLAAAKRALTAWSSEGSDALRLEAETARRAADASEDYREGRRAFAEKRRPRFEGR